MSCSQSRCITFAIFLDAYYNIMIINRTQKKDIIYGLRVSEFYKEIKLHSVTFVRQYFYPLSYWYFFQLEDMTFHCFTIA